MYIMTHMHEYTRINIYLEESGAVLTYSACVYTQQFASCAWYMIETSTEGEGVGECGSAKEIAGRGGSGR